MKIKKFSIRLHVLESITFITHRAGWQVYSYQTGEPWRPSRHGGKTPANSHVPPTPLRGIAAQRWVQGIALPRPASREACRRAAVERS